MRKAVSNSVAFGFDARTHNAPAAFLHRVKDFAVGGFHNHGGFHLLGVQLFQSGVRFGVAEQGLFRQSRAGDTQIRVVQNVA